MKTAVRNWTELKASEVMRTPVVTLAEDVALNEAAQLLSEEHISGAPVVDHRGEPMGVVSLFDIVSDLAGVERHADEPGGFYRQGRLLFPPAAEEEPEPAPFPDEADEDTTVSEIMAPGLIGVPATATLGEVARTLWDKQIHRVFVLDVRGRVVGVISTMDLLRVLVGGS